MPSSREGDEALGSAAASRRESKASERAAEADFDDWAWMEDMTYGDSWTSFDDNRPYKSFDFGDNGYTASINPGSELLQLTAPDSRCGLVHVRGSFENGPDAILARAQRRFGGKSTFGLKLLPDSDSDYQLSRASDQGCLNFRWPCTEYDLAHDANGSRTGTCIAFSFVKDGVVYQVLRLKPDPIHRRSGRRRSTRGINEEPDDPTGPDNVSESMPSTRSNASAKGETEQEPDCHAKIRLGGKIRFGCSCEDKFTARKRYYSVQTPNNADPHVMTCENFYHEKRLEMQLFVDGEMVSIPRSGPPVRPPLPGPPPTSLHLSAPPNTQLLPTQVRDRDPSDLRPYRPAEENTSIVQEATGKLDRPFDPDLYSDAPPFPPSGASLRMPSPPLDIPLPSSPSVTDVSNRSSLTKSRISSEHIRSSTEQNVLHFQPSMYPPADHRQGGPIPPPPLLQSEADAFYDRVIVLKPGKVTLVVASFSIKDTQDRISASPLPSSKSLINYLGTDVSSPHATDRLWLERIEVNGDDGFYDLCTSAACLEQILSVTSLPMPHLAPPRPLNSPTSVPGHPRASSQHSEKNVGASKIDQSHSVSPTVHQLGSGGQSPGLKINTDLALDATQSASAASRPQSELRNDSNNSDEVEAGPIYVTAINTVQDTTQESSSVVSPSLAETRKHELQAVFPKREIASHDIPNSVTPGSSDSRISQVIPDNTAKDQMNSSTPNLISLRDVPKSESHDQKRIHDSNLGIALLGGIFGQQEVDLQQSFWQIRFLVKSYIFLATQHERPPIHPERNGAPSLSTESSGAEHTQALETIRSSYLERIKYHIHHCLIWIANASTETEYLVSAAAYPYGSGSKRPGCPPSFRNVDTDMTLYPLIAIWFVVRNLKESLPISFYSILKENLNRLGDQYSGKEDPTKTEQSTKLSLLLWYHYGCLNKLSQTLAEMPLSGHTWSQRVKESSGRARLWRRKAEKSMATTKKTQIDAYSDQDEDIDRLAFLALELGLVSSQEEQDYSSCSAQARRRILERQHTTVINPGQVPPGQETSGRVPTSAPWELSCANHHSRLVVAKNSDKEDEDSTSYRNNCLQFLTSSFTYVPSWDMSRSDSAAVWWDLDASCIICATVLEMRLKSYALNAVKPEEGLGLKIGGVKRDARRPSLAPRSPIADYGQHDDEMLRKSDSRDEKDLLTESVLDLLRRQMDQQSRIIDALKQESDTISDFDWKLCKPTLILHPDTWVQSLDDTPELFRSSQTKKVQLRTGIRRYLTGQWKDNALLPGILSTTLEPPDWTVENIFSQFGLDELVYISVFGINVSFWDTPGPAGRLRKQWPFHQSPMSLWIAFLNGQLDENNPDFKSLPDDVQHEFQGFKLTDARGAVVECKEVIKSDLLRTLTDSLVDQKTRNRIFFIQRCSPSIVKAFIYIWHTHAIDTFDDHFSGSSCFSDFRGDTWTTSITLAYWGLKVPGDSAHSFSEGRDSAPFPPSNVKLQKRGKSYWWKPEKSITKANKEIEEGCSSLVISSDRSGSRWICTVISTILPEDAKVNCDEEARSTFLEFIHQPSSGRCVVFLLFLGALCQSLAYQYEEILDELKVAIKLGRQVLKEGLDWEHEEDAILRLKAMLWALEALRIFDDRLAESIEKVKDAKERMLKYLNQGLCRREEHLERQYQIRIEEFQKKYDRLVAVHVNIEQKIVQISRYREGISAVSNLEDTHTALKQNDTIRILTYITIAYLPLSFVAALFSTKIVNDSWTGSLFGALVVIFLTLTFILARSLGIIMRTWDRLTKRLGKRLGNSPEMHDSDSIESKEDTTPNIAGASTSVQPSDKWPLLYMKRRRHKKVA